MTDPIKVKTCTRCKVTKPETAFHRSGKQGRNSMCAPCRAEVRRARGREESRRTPESSLRGKLLRLYGITLEQFQELSDAQGGVCAICRKPPPEGKRLAVDHCHSTGAVRALLCIACNAAVGIYELHDRAVADYLATYGAGNPLLK